MTTDTEGLIERLGFAIEDRGGIHIVAYRDGGCRPASEQERLLWSEVHALQQPGERDAEIARAAAFLLDRLSELDESEELPPNWFRDWCGHVEPAIARVRNALQGDGRP